ncbi:MAG: hypothetical protein ACOX9B_04960 [Candidatus Xenobium sp.]
MNTETKGATPPNREKILADLVRLQSLSRELGELCRATLEGSSQGPAHGLSEKAQESIRLVESLVDQASGQESLDRYRATTSQLEDLIAGIASAADQEDLDTLRLRAAEAVDEWASAVGQILEGVLSRARP